MTNLPALASTVKTVPPASTITDEQLMEMIRARNNEGLAVLHQRYAPLLQGLSMKVLHNDADAEDLLQEVFVEIWERAASFDPLKGRPLSWIATLTRRRSIDRLRRREVYVRTAERFAEETQAHSEGWTHVQEEVARGEMNDHLQGALSKLPELQRQAIILAYHRQMSQREIAVHTGIPLGTIKTRLELGLRKMAVSLFGLRELLLAESHAASV